MDFKFHISDVSFKNSIYILSIIYTKKNGN